MSGSLAGLLSFATNQRRLGIELTFYELLANGSYLKLFSPPDGFEMHDVPVHGHPRPIVPNRQGRFPFRGERLTSAKLETGARLVLVLAVEPPATAAAARPTLDVRWYGGSYIELPVERTDEAKEAAQASRGK